MNGRFAGCAALFLLATGKIPIGVEVECCSEARQAHNTLTAAERAEGWQLLFDGQTTHGWRGFRRPDMPAGWLVLDGELQRVDSGGAIITVEQFAAFVLDDERHRDGRRRETSAGANYALHASSPGAVRPAETWNAARIIAQGSHVEHWLNGVKVVEYELWSPEWEELVATSKWDTLPGYGRQRRGHIALQDHGDWVAYRNIKIRPL